ncbi:hypothetical protein OQJ19_12725 [Fluoribacter gormanii]|uniref:Uncharacterized protein n=1 Tax=Fluoribacter gormanii TaxID=464 RepID=A0A377GLI5_9GAMM|nr:hypothetical protein [Fluoribacter gormanii]KTD01844.1 hypothetical protein Lgor_2221 [Fluoribacter gormanii]MCW8471504.1 hypothetical protein [Fluoribacter gormanii]SIR22813.1 hypothetical protein SAMN05421777_10890 [Fluoribacter gormanii]STO25385.1 Uncharacterised protein [Fluoribacter gormanii]
MQAKLLTFFKTQSIPKTSQEAYEILASFDDLSNIEKIVFHFKQLVNIEKSVLNSHTLSNGRIGDNKEFIDGLEARLKKLQDAVNDGKPYQSLYGDVCRLKEDLQVIMGYYQSQIKRDQPIVRDYLRKTQYRNSDLAILASSIAAEDTSLLDEQDTKVLTKYSINFCAPTIMKEDIEKIGDIVQKSFLADHRHEPEFSYM